MFINVYISKHQTITYSQYNLSAIIEICIENKSLVNEEFVVESFFPYHFSQKLYINNKKNLIPKILQLGNFILILQVNIYLYNILSLINRKLIFLKLFLG